MQNKFLWKKNKRTISFKKMYSWYHYRRKRRGWQPLSLQRCIWHLKKARECTGQNVACTYLPNPSTMCTMQHKVKKAGEFNFPQLYCSSWHEVQPQNLNNMHGLNVVQTSVAILWLVGWLVGLVLWHINLCRLFNTKSILM